MKISGLFNEIAAEIYGSGYDRDLTEQEEAELLTAVNAIEEDPATSQTVLGVVGQQVDGWAAPIGVCILGLIKRIMGT